MRRLMPAPALCALVLAACGGSSKPAWQEASPCLRPLATFFDHGRPTKLPWRNPFSQSPSSQMTSPKTFQREVELSYPLSQPGANAVQLFFFDKQESAQRVLRRVQSTQSFLPGERIETVGPAILHWSSAPSAGQRARVTGCLP